MSLDESLLDFSVSVFSDAFFSSFGTTLPSTNFSLDFTVTCSETVFSSFLSVFEFDRVISPLSSLTSNPVASSLFIDDNKDLKFIYFPNSSVDT